MVSFKEMKATKEFISRKKRHYEAVLDYVRQEFIRFNRRTKGKIIHSIIPRDPKVKTIKSIEEKIERKRREKSGYSFKTIEDITGIRITCYYLSDVDRIIDYIRTNPSFLVLTPDEEAKKEYQEGYRAYHYIMTLQGDILKNNPSFRNIKCELQIKTILQDSWSSKTHPLTYKKDEGEIKAEYKDHLRLLSDLLHLADRQSELIKDQIKAEEERKKAYIQEYLKVSTDYPLDETTKKFYSSDKLELDSVDQETAIKLLKYFISSKLGRFSKLEPLSSGEIRNILAQINKYEKKFEINVDVSRIVALLAVIQGSDELADIAIDFADKAIQTLKGCSEAHRHKGMILFYLNRTNEALTEMEETLNLAEKEKNQSEVNRAKANWAYFIAELADSKKLIDTNMKRKAFQYINSAISYATSKNSSLLPNFKDTLGFLKIVFGESCEEVEEGLKLCKKAFNVLSPEDKRQIQPYYKKHLQKAYQKLLRFLE